MGERWDNNEDSFADRLATLTRQLAAQDSPLALGLWERGTAVRIGQVTRAIKGREHLHPANRRRISVRWRIACTHVACRQCRHHV